jgi:hypothetical protein
MNFNGIIIALATGLLIWFGHVWVVKLHSVSGTKLWFVPLILGIVCVVVSIVAPDNLTSAITAIAAVTFFWGIKELFEYKEKLTKQE